MALSEARYSEVAAAFDAIAPAFESSFENETTRALRNEVYSSIRSLIPAGSSILDINCGVGIDAMALAANGYSVTGIDISPGMLEQARKRSQHHPQLSVNFVDGSFDDLSPVAGRTFDLVLSNFGGMNCAGSLSGLFTRVGQVLRPGGYFFAVIMSRVSLWETVAGLCRFDPSLAFRRLRNRVRSTGFRELTFTVYYHSVKDLLKLSSPWFQPISLRAVWIISPPPHAETFRKTFPRLSRWLYRADQLLAPLPILRTVGDHAIVLLRRNSTLVNGAES